MGHFSARIVLMIGQVLSKIALSGFLIAAGDFLALFRMEIGLRIRRVEFGGGEQIAEMKVDPAVGWTYEPR